MREPARSYNWFEGEFKEPHKYRLCRIPKSIINGDIS